MPVNILEATLPGYDVNMGSAFGFNNGQLVLNNYNFLKHGNVYHAEDGTLTGYDELFNLGEGLTVATGLGVAGAGAGAVTGPGAVVTGAGAFVAGGVSYASTTELNSFKDITIDKIVLGYTFELNPRPMAPAYLFVSGFFTRNTTRFCLTSYLISALAHIQASQQLLACKYFNTFSFENTLLKLSGTTNSSLVFTSSFLNVTLT